MTLLLYRPVCFCHMNMQYPLESYAYRPRVSRGGHTGSAQGLPVCPPREERTKHKTKPRRNLGNHAFFNNCVFMLLFNCLCFRQYRRVLFSVRPQYSRDCYRKPLGKHSEQNKIMRYGVPKACESAWHCEKGSSLLLSSEYYMAFLGI